MHLRALSSAIGLLGAALLLCGACGQILGLDDFEDARPASGSTGSGGASASSGSAGGPAGGAGGCSEDPTAACEGKCGDVELCGRVVTCAGCEGELTCGSDARPNLCTCAVAPCALWSQAFGDADEQQVRALAIDGDGNVLLTGSFASSIDLGGGPLDAVGSGSDIFLAKLSPSGAHSWSKSLGGTLFQEVADLAVDAVGNVAIAGRTAGTVDFGDGPKTALGTTDLFVAKFDASGAHVFSLLAGDDSTNIQEANAVAFDASGRVLLTGRFTGTMSIDGWTLTSAGLDDIFLARFDPDGMVDWAYGFAGPSNNQAAFGVAVDGSGASYLVANVFGTVDFGGGSLTSAGQADFAVAKFDAGGGHVWSRVYGDGGPQLAGDVAVDATGNVVVAGKFRGTIDFGGEPLTDPSTNTLDIFVAKLDTNGNRLWSKRFGDGASQDVADVALGADGSIYIVGSFSGTVDFGGGPLSAAAPDNDDMYIARFDANGQHVWSRAFGGAVGQQNGLAIAVSGGDEVQLGGSFDGDIDFGVGAHTTMGVNDGVIARLLQ